MSWNYRVMRHRMEINGGEEFFFEIHEVYYDDKDDPDNRMWSTESIAPSAENLDELTDVIIKMQDALQKPVLDYETGKEIE